MRKIYSLGKIAKCVSSNDCNSIDEGIDASKGLANKIPEFQPTAKNLKILITYKFKYTAVLSFITCPAVLLSISHQSKANLNGKFIK